MKRFSFIIALLLALVLVSCNKKEYTNAIPKDASFVAQLNMAKIYNDMDLSHSPVITTMHTYLNFMVFDKKNRNRLSDYIDNPETMGIDFTQPLYFFKAGPFMGLTMQLASKDDMEDFLEVLQKLQLCSRQKGKDGFQVCALLNEIAVAYSNSSMLFLFNSDGGSIAMCQNAAVQLMQQGEDQSFCSTLAFQSMQAETDNDAVCVGNIKALPTEASDMLKVFFPKGSKMGDVNLLTTINAVNGTLDVCARMTAVSQEGRTAIDGFQANTHFLEGRYNHMPFANSFFWACAGVKGEVLLEALRKVPSIHQGLTVMETAIDIEQILRSMDGDVAVHSFFPSHTVNAGHERIADDDKSVMHLFQINIGRVTPEVAFVGHLKSKAFLDDVDYWLKNMQKYGVEMKKVGDSEDYFLGTSTYNLWWGVQDDDFYLATDQVYKNGIFDKHSDGYIIDKLSKSSRLYIYINVESLKIPYLSGFNSVRIRLK